MRIANIMLSRGLGGIEQAFLDYNDALRMAGHHVLAITHLQADINALLSNDVQSETLNNRGSWDVVSAFKLRKILKRFSPDATITHGNRALNLAFKAGKVKGKHIAVTHNYNLQHFHKCDAVFAITEDLKLTVMKAGFAENKISVIPNMVRLVENKTTQEETQNSPFVIGSMGRLIESKGFGDLILAAKKISALTRTPFLVRIAGDGEHRATLQALIEQHKLGDKIQLLGWITDKKTFYEQCDIFCLPSHQEAFGIVILEAMSYGKPVVAYTSKGPSAIFGQHPTAGVLVPNKDIGLLANKLCDLISNPPQQKFLSAQALKTVRQHYSLDVVSNKMDAALKILVSS